MSLANCFNLYQTKILSSDKGLREYFLTPTNRINSILTDSFTFYHVTKKVLSKLKAFTANKLNVTQNIEFVSSVVENIAEERRKCWLPAFSPFPTMFSKAFFFLRGVMVGIVG